MNRKRIYTASLAFSAFLASSAVLADSQQLKVVGNQIVTANGGCTMRLRGVNVDGMEFDASGSQGPPGQGITATVAEAVTAWGANIVRIPLNQDWWFGCGGGGTNGANYQAIIDSIVNYCNANGAYALLDLHWSGTHTGTTVGQSDPPCSAGNGWGSDSTTKQQYMPDDNSVTFWSSVAAHYANAPAVLFDLYNEPFDYDSNGWSIWQGGGTGTSYSFHTPGMQALLGTVRAAGANNIVVVGGLDYAYDLTGVAYNLCGGSPCALSDPSGYGVIYSTHIYPWKGSSPWVPANGDSKITPAAYYYPVLIGEFGQNVTIAGYTPNPDTNGTWDQTLLQWADGNNSAAYQYNWTAWDMHTGSSPILISNWSYTPTTWNGVPVKNELATPPPTCVSTLTPTPTLTPCGYPGNTCTPTDTPTATSTPNPSNDVAWPNPWDGSQPVSFYHTLETPADSVHLKVFTLAFRKIYDDGSLPTSAGQQIYTLAWSQLGNVANGLYYLVVEEERGQNIKRTVIKLLVRR